MRSVELMADGLIATVKGYVDHVVGAVRKELAELTQMAAALEQRVAELPAPKDGANGRDGLDGKDGEPGPKGVDGRDGRDGQTGIQGEKGVDGRDGTNGIDGKDGLGFDDLSVEYDGERSFTLKFQRGEQTKEFAFKIPVVIDRGVFKPDKSYERSDGVTYGGSWWLAQKDAPEGKPGFGGDWRLAVKRGQDGKDLTEPKQEPPQVVRIR